MTITEKNYTALEADEGCVLTNGTIYSTKVFLGKHDSGENWSEVELTEEIQSLMNGGETNDAE